MAVLKARKLSDGRSAYDVALRVNGRMETHTEYSAAEAKRYELRRKAEIAAGRAHARPRGTLRAYLETWLTDVVDAGLAPTTAHGYRWEVNHRILPSLGAIKLADLSPARLQRWVGELSRTPTRAGTLSPVSIRISARVLHSALGVAVSQGILPTNPLAGVRLPRAAHQTAKSTWTIEETRRFLAVASSDAYEPLWTLALSSGLRRAELLGLRWSDVDLDLGVAHIRQTHTKAGSTPITKAPKNESSRRPVPLPAGVVALLTSFRQAQATHAESMLDAWCDHDLICCTPYGTPWYPDTISHRFKALVELAGVPPVNLHYTRHTYASLALAAGQGLRAVSEVLGHANPRVTQEIYQHIDDAGRRGVAEAVGGLLIQHSEANVGWNDGWEGKAPAETEASPEVHPWGFGPQTFRSAIGRESRIVALGTKRRGPNKHARVTAGQRESSAG